MTCHARSQFARLINYGCTISLVTSVGIVTRYANSSLLGKEMCVILHSWESHRAKGSITPLFSEGIKALQTKEGRAIQ